MTGLPNFAQQVADLRDYLMKFARLQLRNETWAEDAVSEVMVAALAKPQAFGNRSQLKTWLVGILKHKIIDTLRLRGREVFVEDDDKDSNEDPLDYLGFQADGHYVEPPPNGVIPSTRPAAANFLKCWKPASACSRQRKDVCF